MTPKNIGEIKTPLLMAVFLVLSGVIFGAQGSYKRSENGIVLGVLGGPIMPSVEKLPLVSERAQGVILFPESAPADSQGVSDPYLGLAGSNTALALFPPGVEMTSVSYSVKKKDTLSGIAKALGVSEKDILGANPVLKKGKSALKVGTVLALAVPVKSSDDQSSTVEADLKGGDSPAHSEVMTLAESKAYFRMPADGFNWGKLHNYNAVDIANVCGTPIVAPADGIVVNDENFGDGSGDWNGGYGHFVLLEHPNGTRTRMAHLDTISVAIGDMVKRGQQLGIMGQTGDATGCHVHFEVIGAPNPFVKS